MRALIRTIVAGILITTSAQAQEPAADAYQGAIIKRWSPVVSDLDRAIHLYRDILGFELARVFEDQPDSYVYPIFNITPGTTTRHAIFNAGEEQRVLSVVEMPGMEASRVSEAPRMSALLVNANGRFDEIVALLRMHDYALLPFHKLGENGIEVGFQDADGHLYALYQVPYDGVLLPSE